MDDNTSNTPRDSLHEIQQFAIDETAGQDVVDMTNVLRESLCADIRSIISEEVDKILTVLKDSSEKDRTKRKSKVFERAEVSRKKKDSKRKGVKIKKGIHKNRKWEREVVYEEDSKPRKKTANVQHDDVRNYKVKAVWRSKKEHA